MAAISATVKKMSQVKETFNRLSLTNYFLVSVGLPPKIPGHLQNNYGGSGIDFSSFAEKLGLLCHEASLPTSSYATSEVKDNFMGVTQEFAHTRMYSDLDFSFYVDDEYKAIMVFEGWMDYISGGSERTQGQEPKRSYYRRMNWPNDYKTDNLYITKFERDMKRSIEYQFINAFPKTFTSIPVSYGGADISKITVSFNFDRYIAKRSSNPINFDNPNWMWTPEGLEWLERYYAEHDGDPWGIGDMTPYIDRIDGSGFTQRSFYASMGEQVEWIDDPQFQMNYPLNLSDLNSSVFERAYSSSEVLPFN